jgi:hypothetical protein
MMVKRPAQLIRDAGIPRLDTLSYLREPDEEKAIGVRRDEKNAQCDVRVAFAARPR